MSARRLLIALTACLALVLGACTADDQANPETQTTSLESSDPETTTTTEGPVDPSCREAIDFTLAAITSSAEQAVGDIDSFATEDELGEVLLEFLFSLPEDIGIDPDEACENARLSISELKQGLERTIRNEPEPVTDLTLALLAIGCSEDMPAGPDDDPAETEAFVSEICPVIEDYFDRRGFSLEGSPGEPGFR